MSKKSKRSLAMSKAWVTRKRRKLNAKLEDEAIKAKEAYDKTVKLLSPSNSLNTSLSDRDYWKEKCEKYEQGLKNKEDQIIKLKNAIQHLQNLGQAIHIITNTMNHVL